MLLSLTASFLDWHTWAFGDIVSSVCGGRVRDRGAWVPGGDAASLWKKAPCSQAESGPVPTAEAASKGSKGARVRPLVALSRKDTWGPQLAHWVAVPEGGRLQVGR